MLKTIFFYKMIYNWCIIKIFLVLIFNALIFEKQDQKATERAIRKG